MRVSLRAKFLLLVAGTVTGLAVLLLGAITLLANIETERTVHRDVETTGGVLARFIHEQSDALTDKCLLLAHQPRLVYLRGANPETIADSLGEWLKQMHADAALLTDQDGHMLGATNGHTADSKDLHTSPGVATALQGQVWTGVVASNGILMLAVTVPVVDGASKVVLMTFTAYSHIDSRLASDLKQALGSDVAFLYRGRIVGASLALPSDFPAPKGAPAQITVDGVRYVALYAPLPDTEERADMGFVTLRPYEQAIGFYRRFQRTLGGILLVALLLALTAGAAMARNLTRPLDGVVQAATALSRGDWPERFEVKRTDEIGLLQTVFNEMTVSLRDSRERLLALIDTDPLTGLDNHRRFQERLIQEAKRCAASSEALSLLLFDLDHFHDYNLQNGHAAGDEALQRFARLLQNALPEVAIPARYGGEEFAVLLPQHTLEQGEALAERLRGLFCPEADREGQEALTVSVGCAEFGSATTQAEGLILAAELAVSRAKQLGRNRVCRFDSVPGANDNADPYQMHRFLKDGSLATIQALAAAVDAKDPYTQGHSQRVAEYASRLARHIGLPEATVEIIYTTGTLHDVGKIGVPDAILKKPGRLDDEERVVMETHPVLGEVIVRKVPQLAYTLPGVRHHHERWDGKGYPDGLAGTGIPHIARILAVADTYDAMTSDRPYRKGLAVEIALGEIEKGGG